MPVKVRPLHDRIIVERLEDTEQVVGFTPVYHPCADPDERKPG